VAATFPSLLSFSSEFHDGKTMVCICTTDASLGVFSLLDVQGLKESTRGDFPWGRGHVLMRVIQHGVHWLLLFTYTTVVAQLDC